MHLTIRSAVGRGMGGPLVNLEATAKSTDQRLPGDLRDLAFGQDDVVQYWLDAQDLRLVLYSERAAGEHAETTITVMTQAREEGVFDGNFRATIYTAPSVEPVVLEGTISCSVE